MYSTPGGAWRGARVPAHAFRAKQVRDADRGGVPETRPMQKRRTWTQLGQVRSRVGGPLEAVRT